MNNNERESIIGLLKEKDVLLNMRKHFNYHFIDGKIYVAIILAAVGFFQVFSIVFYLKTLLIILLL